MLYEPEPSEKNVSRQIKLLGCEFSLISFYNTEFLCDLKMKITINPVLFQLLEILEYKFLLLHRNGNALYQKYSARLF
jgi:hypothetical protein